MIQGLRAEEIRAFVMTQPNQELNDWLVWQEGWDLWKPLLEMDDLLTPISRTVRGSIPSVEVSRSQTMTDSQILNRDQAVMERQFKDITASDINLNSELDIEVLGSKPPKKSLLRHFVKRNFKRYKKQLKIQIKGTDGQVFSSTTIDISVGGIHIAEPLPTWVVGYNQVKIIDPIRKQAIEVTCSVVEDQAPGQRVRLEILPLQIKQEEVHFDKWLAA
jgi:hypothetical protein